MRCRWSLLVMTAAAAIAVARLVRADESSARDLVKSVFDHVPKAAFSAKATLTSDRGWVRELDFSHKHIGDVDASYLEVTAPLDLKDTRFLLYDRVTGRDEQFIYVPAMRRTIQVNTETRKQPFLGSDFYICDMVRPEFDAYTYRFVGEEDVGGRHCKLVESVPKAPADELYGKTITAIDPVDALVLRTEFFDKQGKLLKIWTIDKLEKIDGNWTPLVQKMKNVQDHHESQLQLNDVKYNAQLPDEMFERSYLQH